MKDVLRRNLRSDYTLLCDVEEALKNVKKVEKDVVSTLSISEQIDKIKCVEYNIMQMILLCLEDDQTFYDLWLKKD